MKVLAILVPEGCVLATVSGPRQMFTAVNQFLVNQGREPLFDLKLVGLNKEVRLMDGLVTIFPDWQLAEANDADVIIVPALSGDLIVSLEQNQAFVPWIIAQHARGAEVASLCIGAFLLGSTGLLAGKYCSTHWMFAQQFRTMFPDAVLMDDKIITEQNVI